MSDTEKLIQEISELITKRGFKNRFEMQFLDGVAYGHITLVRDDLNYKIGNKSNSEKKDEV